MSWQGWRALFVVAGTTVGSALGFSLGVVLAYWFIVISSHVPGLLVFAVLAFLFAQVAGTILGGVTGGNLADRWFRKRFLRQRVRARLPRARLLIGRS